MKIKKLVLFKYVRLFLSHINKITYTPENKISLILGTNGGGKSSLMKELSPLPADLKREFEDDGYKVIEIEHNNSLYILSSGYIAKNKHSFVIDDQELNPAGTKKVQLLLVKEHFNITQEIHNVMLGLKGFTTMSVMERKNWLTNISTVDYTYSLSIFNKFKQRNRDILGALKIVQSELSKSDSSILSSEDKNKINEEISILKDSIELLIKSKLNHTNLASVDEDYIRHNINISKNILLNTTIPDINIKNIDNEFIKNEIIIKDKTKRKEEIEDILKELMFIEDTKEGSLDDIDKEITNIKDELIKLTKSVYIDLDLNDITKFKSTFEIFHTELLELLEGIISHTTDEYTFNNYKEDTELLRKYNDDLVRTKDFIIKLDNTKNNMEHKRDHNSVTCTQCEYTWSIGFKPKDYKYLLEKIKENNDKVISLEKLISDLNEKTEFFSVKLSYIDKIRKLMSDPSIHVLKPLFIHIRDNANIDTEAYKAVDILNRVNNDIPRWLDHNAYMSDLDNKLKDRKIVAEKREIELKHFNSNKEKIEEELFNLTNLLNETKINNKTIDIYIKNRDILNNNNETFIKFLKIKNKEYINNLINLRNNAINDIVSSFNLEISKLEHRLSESTYNEKLIENSKNKVKLLKKQKEATSLLIDAMSPTNGLIGKSITNFLNVFTKDMNDIINSIWNYDMEILPCKITEANDLDYKFEVKIDNRMPVKDVSETSSSQQEIIDLAFKIVSMKYLKMDNSYLLLDEFGRTFDEAHSKNAYDIIDILSNSSFTNVFIISHFTSTYSRFKNADISLLNGDNMILDKELKINTVMTIE